MGIRLNVTGTTMTGHISEMEIATKMHPTVKIMTIFSLTRDFNFRWTYFISFARSFVRLFGSILLFSYYLNGEKVSNERDNMNNEKHDYINSVYKLLQPFVSFFISFSSFLFLAPDIWNILKEEREE